MKIKVYSRGNGYDLKGLYDTETNHLLIFKNSTYRKDTTKSILPHIVRYREEVLSEYGSVNCKLTDDYDFKSPGAAACVMFGGMANGLIFFKIEENDRPLKSIFDSKKAKCENEIIQVENNRPLYLPEEKRFKRIYSVGKKALKNSDYLCFVNANHETFVTDSGTQYMEAHHLIPFKFQKKFRASLQVQANIVCLCPQCHRELHYGKNRREILKRLYEDRISSLRECDLDVSFENLLKCYEMKK